MVGWPKGCPLGLVVAWRMRVFFVVGLVSNPRSFTLGCTAQAYVDEKRESDYFCYLLKVIRL